MHRDATVHRARRATLLGLLAALALLAGASTVQAGGVWRRGETADPGSLDPHRTSTSVEQHILDELYEGLTVYDGHGALRPGVAASWQVSADGLIYTFILRPDARWSNGERVTADDFVYSLRRLMDPRTGAGYANILYMLRNARLVNTGALAPDALGVRALDAGTLEIALEHRSPVLLDALTHMTAMPVHRASVERWGDGFARAGRMIGNGAFVLRRYRPNDRLVLAKNPYFHDAASVALDGEEIVPVTDRSAGLRRFMAGELDSYNELPTDQIAFIRQHLADSLRLTPSLGTSYYALDTRRPPLDDVRVRQALAMAVDRDFLSDAIWGGTTRPSLSFVAPGLPGYGAPSRVAWAGMDPFAREDEARRLMREAGHGPDHPLHLTLHLDQGENNKGTAVAVADMWRVLGVACDFVVSDAASFFSYLGSGAPFQVARSGWFADFPDAENFLFLAESGNRGLNYAHFHDPAFDALMGEADVEADVAKRQALMHRAETVLLAQMPYLPLMSYDAPNLVSPRLAGWDANILDHHPGRYVSKR